MVEGDLLILGLGAMGSALARGIISSGTLRPAQVWGYDAVEAKMQSLKSELGIQTASAPDEGLEHFRAIVLVVKPDVVPSLLKQLSTKLDRRQLVISLAAGITLAQLQRWSGDAIPIIRVMTNILVSYRKGTCALAPGKSARKSHLATAKSLFDPLGVVVEVAEKDMDAVTALAGSGPAFVFYFIEALRDAGVRCGLSKEVALRMAAQTVEGAAHAVLETGSHPGLLRDQVTSPGGTTTHGLQALESRAFRAGIIEAIIAATTRAGEISRALGEN